MSSILILGKQGKLAQTFQRRLPNAVALGRPEVNLEDRSIDHSFRTILNQYEPKAIINCAAYTDVDGAESNRELAYSINATAVGNLAEICHRYSIKLVHFSTDYVFNGNNDFAYPEDAQPNPANYYGYTKLAGEILALHSNPETLIIRFSSPFGLGFNNNFPSKVIFSLKNGLEVKAVTNQWFLPTWADDLVDATIKLLAKQTSGRVHFCNSGILGPITPYQYAVYIAELLGCSKNKIVKLLENSMNVRPAMRPVKAILGTKLYASLIEEPRTWKDALKEYLSAQ